ncbi:MAG: 50S ribosomal protein L6 [Candidatus Marinimicrobia bacterium]|jgi:large subunit ribosomal protein L6|nr:50S ribosomal protein L6 [Candidatus Neomarinimicrobiota bacterium]MDP6456046.1 50S ribosomal protein L6 [Candidatus Neomarinimicrobiota bacterium]MDP6592645.1 50S ribosomal protein L6 [Candidatus Neomarinimicrobiota bacterium]MDP6836491.1 50S ribosomal protein L6 [Candidatus Neomarinimicrobiota bacterium]|tara:strand:- start:9906 stop:10442 length:537 start_codon:yes stop_codon:yes gene_type:complete
MSRIGKQPIAIPEGVKVSLKGSRAVVEGPKGTLEFEFNADMIIKQEKEHLEVQRPSDSKTYRSLHGTTRALLSNMVHGVSDGFSKDLEIIGIGFSAVMERKRLKLALGYSHDIYFEPPEEIEIKATKSKLTVSGIDRQLVGQVAAKIRSFNPPEPYKGKGIRYADEHVSIKKGKTVGE